MQRIKAVLTICAVVALCCLPIMASAATTNYPEVVTGIQVIPFHFPGAITATVTPVKIRLPFKTQVLGVSAYSRVIDTSSGNETQTVDVLEGASSILSAAISLAAQDTIYEGTISDTSIADEATVSIVLTLGGTTPSLTDTTVLLTVRRTN
ncbi:MAG: hypothetical protein HZB62_10750 [Nitrospirae bacterium]|nr:hypothetical protein [Nitrospirota bacterium]